MKCWRCSSDRITWQVDEAEPCAYWRCDNCGATGDVNVRGEMTNEVVRCFKVFEPGEYAVHAYVTSAKAWTERLNPSPPWKRKARNILIAALAVVLFILACDYGEARNARSKLQYIERRAQDNADLGRGLKWVENEMFLDWAAAPKDPL